MTNIIFKLQLRHLRKLERAGLKQAMESLLTTLRTGMKLLKSTTLKLIDLNFSSNARSMAATQSSRKVVTCETTSANTLETGLSAAAFARRPLLKVATLAGISKTCTYRTARA
jgi:hypothetical protein